MADSSHNTFAELADFYRSHLLEDVMPFWSRHGLDRERGGLFSCLDDDGRRVGDDKFIVSNARALWLFSALERRFGPRDEWRETADSIFRFLRDHGRDADGHWVCVVSRDGDVVTGYNSIVTAAFVIYGMTEYFRLSGEQAALDLALDTYRLCKSELSRPGSYPTVPYPTPPGMKPQREAMQFSRMFCLLGEAAGDERILEDGLALGRDVLDHFWRPERGVLLEFIGLDNHPRDTPPGRTMVPGHALESLWYQIENFRLAGDAARCRQAARAMRPCLEQGWDPEFGGLFLGVDVEGRTPPYWPNAQVKLWWPHTEALCAPLLAAEEIGEDWCLEWQRRVHDWTFARFPNETAGAWNQSLDREGRIARGYVEIPVKDPYHTPRGLMTAIASLERLASL